MEDAQRQETDAAIAAAWPQRWAKANAAKKPSKARANLRKRWLGELAFREWRSRHPNASCKTCRHFGFVPPQNEKRCCDLDSDFYGYALAKPDGVCMRWKEARK